MVAQSLVPDRSLLRSKSEICGFVKKQEIHKWVEGENLLFSDVRRSVRRLVDFFSVLGRAGVGPGEYVGWVEGRGSLEDWGNGLNGLNGNGRLEGRNHRGGDGNLDGGGRGNGFTGDGEVDEGGNGLTKKGLIGNGNDESNKSVRGNGLTGNENNHGNGLIRNGLTKNEINHGNGLTGNNNQSRNGLTGNALTRNGLTGNGTGYDTPQNTGTISLLHEDWKLHRDLSQAYFAYTRAKQQVGVLDAYDVMAEASKLLQDTELNDRNRGVLFGGFDVLVMDDIQFYDPLQCQFAMALAKWAKHKVIMCVDTSSKLHKPNIVSMDNETPLRSIFESLQLIELKSKLEPAIQEKIHQAINLTSKSEEDEIHALLKWASEQDSQTPITIMTRSSGDRDVVATALRALQMVMTSDSHKRPVLVMDKKESLLDTPEVRSLCAFLGAACRGHEDSADRELYCVLTSGLFQYNPTVGDLKLLGHQRTRAFVSMRDALESFASGKNLLEHLLAMETRLAKGEPASQVLMELLKVLKLDERLSNPNNESDEESAKRVAKFLNIVVRLETMSGTRRLKQIVPASALEVLQHLEELHEFGGAQIYDDDEFDEDDLDIHDGGEEGLKAVDSIKPIKPISIGTFRSVIDRYAPGSFDGALAIARASSKNMPLNANRDWNTSSYSPSGGFPLPLSLLNQVRAGPMLDTSLFLTKNARVLGEEKLFFTAVTSLKPVKSKKVVYSYRVKEETPSLFFGGSSSGGSGRANSESLQVMPKPARAGKKITDFPVAANLGRVRSLTFASSTRTKVSTEAIHYYTTREDAMQLSYSRLREFETCPKRYYLSRVLGLKAAPNPPMIYGKCLHRGVEEHIKQSNEEEKLNSSLKGFEEEFAGAFSSSEPLPVGFHSKNHIALFRSTGLDVLRDFHARWLVRQRFGGNGGERGGRVQVSAERKFELLCEDVGIIFVGIVDLVETELDANGNVVGAHIVDYKSNVHDGAKLKRLARDSDQLTLYAWAYEVEFGRPPLSMSIESIETGDRCKVSFPSNLARDRLLQVATRVREGDFTPTPSFAGCKFCPYREVCVDSVV